MHLENLLDRDTGAAGETIKEAIMAFVNMVFRGEILDCLLLWCFFMRSF